MAITVAAVFNSGQTDHQANPITLVLASPIAVGHKALLCNASTIDDSTGITPGAGGWGGIDTVTDSRGNTWVRDFNTPVDLVDTFTTVEIWRSDITTALQNGDVLTVTGDTRGLSMEMGVLDCSGLAPGGPDKTKGANMSATTSWSTGAMATTTVADALLVAVAGSTANASGWWTPGGGYTEQVDRGDAGTIQRAVAIQTLIVAATGAYTATGTASGSVTGNMGLVAYSAQSTGQSTGIVQLALGAILKPDTRTGHEIHVRARKANPSEAGVLRVWLYEAGALRSGPFDVGLNDNFTPATILIPDADAAAIGSYANLELRIQGVASSGAITPQVSFVELQTPGASIVDPGATNFPNFDFPARGVAPARFRPGAMMRTASMLADADVAAGGPVSETPNPGGAVAAGVAPVALADTGVGGDPASGVSPTAAAVVPAGAATAGGQTIATGAGVGSGGATSSGTAPGVMVLLTRGAATAGGFQPTDGSAFVETPGPGGAVAKGFALSAAVSTSTGGATATGRALTVKVIIGRGGALSGGQLTDPFAVTAVITDRTTSSPESGRTGSGPRSGRTLVGVGAGTTRSRLGDN